VTRSQLPVLWFDYVDPASYLVQLLLGELRAEVQWRPLELRPPPSPLLRASDPAWREHLGAMGRLAEEEGVRFHPPTFLPWTRKAHELALHAREKGCFAPIHGAIFDALFQEGRDIGRVDVLVAIGAACGLEQTETRAVLDVDRFAAGVEAERAAAAAMGVRGVPTLTRGRLDRLEGFRGRAALEAFLRRDPGADEGETTPG